MSSMTQGFFVSQCLPRMSLAVHQGVCFDVLIVKDEVWSKLSSCCCSKVFSYVGVLEFLKAELDSYFDLLFHPLEAESEGHHYKLMVASYVGSWRVPGLCDVNT